jgi:hypothetical protein
MGDAFVQLEKWQLRVGAIYCNPKDFDVVAQKWAHIPGFNPMGGFDINTEPGTLRAGYRAYLWGSPVLVSPDVPLGNVYLATEQGFELRTVEITILP